MVFMDEDGHTIGVYKDIHGIYDSFFPDVDDFVSELLDAFLRDHLYNPTAHQWTGWPRSAAGSAVADFVTSTASSIASAFVSALPVASQGRSALLGPTLYQSESPAVLVPMVFRSNATSRDELKAWKRLSYMARDIFSTQDGRRFVHGLAVCGSQCRLWVFDRSGAVGSGHIDINAKWNDFVRVLVGYHVMTDEQLGFDPSVYYDDQGRRRVSLPLDVPSDPTPDIPPRHISL